MRKSGKTEIHVLNAEQLLLNSRTTLVSNLASLVTTSYQVTSAVGRLTARDLVDSLAKAAESAIVTELHSGDATRRWAMTVSAVCVTQRSICGIRL